MIETTALAKRYGPTAALDGIDLRVTAGSVYGLVGPNGAGKTTLLGVLAGLRRPTSGTIRIDADPREVAVLPDTPRFEPWLTGREVVALAQHLAAGTDDRVEEVIREAGLAQAIDRRVGGYSRGMLQRLGLACTVVGSPKLLLLDEPASALDPAGRREVLDLIARLRGSATVLFSSHILADVQEVCDTVGIVDGGRLMFQGPIDRLLVGTAVPHYMVRCRPPLDGVIDALRRQDWVRDVTSTGPEEVTVAVRSLGEAELHLVGVLDRVGARVVSFGPEAVSLEQAFLELTR
ncbi:MAG: ABC transporter ATP-binding protein [Kineosporiaceae bacterium]